MTGAFSCQRLMVLYCGYSHCSLILRVKYIADRLSVLKLYRRNRRLSTYLATLKLVFEPIILF